MRFNHIISFFRMLNIQVLIILLSLYAILYPILEKNIEDIDALFIYLSIFSVIITGFLYYKYLKNRINISNKESKEVNNELLDKFNKELNYILINLVVFFIYTLFYLLYVTINSISSL